MSKHLTILGGGPAGLAAGFYARKAGLDFTIYEAGEDVGGLCRTIRCGDFSYDTGAHRFHDRNPDVTRDIKELLGTELKKIAKPSQIWTKGRFVDFPLSPLNLIHFLGIKDFSRAVIEVVRARVHNPAVRSFEDFARSKYGDILAEKFLLNYSKKLWGKPCAQLSPDIAGKRMKGLSLNTFIKESFIGPRSKTEHLDGNFYYPVNGYGSIVERLAVLCGKENIKTGSEITKIFRMNGHITAIEVAGRRKIPVEKVVNTLPLTGFINKLFPGPDRDVTELAESLTYSNLILVAVFLKKESITRNATVYFPDSEIPFTRIYEPKKRSKYMAPVGKTSLIVELPVTNDRTYWNKADKDLIEFILAKLISMGWFGAKDVIGTAVNRLPMAYPLLEKDYADKVRRITDYLKKIDNLSLSGRNGNFTYTHLHDMMAGGKNIVDTLVARGIFEDSIYEIGCLA